jgi:hypothetical protein
MPGDNYPERPVASLSRFRNALWRRAGRAVIGLTFQWFRVALSPRNRMEPEMVMLAQWLSSTPLNSCPAQFWRKYVMCIADSVFRIDVLHQT